MSKKKGLIAEHAPGKRSEDRGKGAYHMSETKHTPDWWGIIAKVAIKEDYAMQEQKKCDAAPKMYDALKDTMEVMRRFRDMCPKEYDDMTRYIGIEWATMWDNNTAALRQLTKHEGKVELGTSEIVYHGPVGMIRIKPHPMIKGGEFIMGNAEKNAKRVGASDVTFNLGVEGQNERFLLELANSAGFEIRTMWDQGVFLRKPRGWVKGTNIVNSN